jgi:hypothetical protein
MNRALLFIACWMCCSLTNAQDLLLISPNKAELNKGEFGRISGGASFRSNALDNMFMEKLVLGGHIGEENKDNVDMTLRDMNRAGGTVMSNMHYRHYADTLFGSTAIGAFAQVQSNYDGYVAFPEDFYNVLFRGNADYNGKTASFSGLEGKFMAYHKMGAGIFHKETLSYASVSYVIGSGYAEGELTNGELYTSELGDSLHLDYQGEFLVTEFGGLNPFTSASPGLALDMGINIPLADDLGYVMLHVNDFGFVDWNKEVTTFSADSSVSWTGIDIQDLFDSSIDELDIPLLDDSLNYNESREDMITWLPTTVSLRILRKIDSRGYGEFGVFTKPNGVHIPRIHAAYHYLVDDQTMVTAKATVGGYGRFRVGASFEKIYKGWFLSAGTEDLPGLLLDKLRGKGAWFSIGKFFGNE